MNNTHAWFRRRRWIEAFFLLLSTILIGACSQPESDTLQGYVEGEFVYVASPLAGALETLSVQRGTQVEADEPLFALEHGSETAARDLAAARLKEGKARWEDAKKGKRVPEVASVQAHLTQSREALLLAEMELKRIERVSGTGAVSEQDMDRARSTRDQEKARVAQLKADLETAGLGSREDQVAAAEANVRALEASLKKAEWDLSQKRQNAPRAGLIFDTLYRPGDWVAAGRPVVALLPPDQIKVRAFVPEPRIGSIQTGDPVAVQVDGVDEPFVGRVSFISPQAEYTPPVIYSEESRSKLVFLIEATFPPEVAVRLHPGQPVDLELIPEE